MNIRQPDDDFNYREAYNSVRILTICPSIHADKLTKMLDSFYLTTSKYNNIVINSDKGSITAIINDMFAKYPDYDYYHITNDDVIYKTPLWDMKLANKGKISHGKDAIDIGVDGQFLMIDGEIARAAGWLQLPILQRYCGDVVWRYIGKQLNILEYVPEVSIIHNWEGADAEINRKDGRAFAQWLPWSFKDIEKIRKVL